MDLHEYILISEKLFMDPGRRLYFKNRQEWRGWLEDNHHKEKEVWLVIYKKHAEKPGIPYEDAVEESICFGCIDTTVKKIDEDRFIQRYSTAQTQQCMVTAK